MAHVRDFDLDSFLRPLDVDDDRLQRLARSFATTYRYLARASTEQFLPTPITALPNGKETGKFLAIDVGGSNLRVGFVELLGERVPAQKDGKGGHKHVGSGGSGADRAPPESPRLKRTHERAWPIGEHLKMDKAEDLFMWIGDCIADVVEDFTKSEASDVGSDTGTEPDEVVMGITFSFPMIQTSLSEATLMPMGKGFAITSNLNLGKLLLAGYERHTKSIQSESNSLSRAVKSTTHERRTRDLPRLRIAAISNDTVATLAAMSYAVKSRPNSRVAMGLIVGTGTNATIPMKLKDLGSWKSNAVVLPPNTDRKNAGVVVNTEWTINGTAPPLRDLGFVTTWDESLDQTSEAPGFQPFEYMTAGRYIGELVRLCVLDIFTNRLGVSETNLPLALRQRNALTTTFVAQVLASAEPSTSLVAHLHHGLPAPADGAWKWTVQTAEIIRAVAGRIQIRSAGLIAAAVVGLLGYTHNIHLDVEDSRSASSISSGDSSEDVASSAEDLVVAATGGVITHYPGFMDSCQARIDALLHREGLKNAGKRIILQEALDGGIIGAGVLAGTVANQS